MPDGWEVVRLGEVAEVLTGSTPPREVNDYYGGCTPWVKLSDLATSHLVRTSDEYLTDKGLAISRMVPKGSVLVSCIGTIGEVAIAGVPLCFNQQINALIPSALVTSSFLYWACLTRADYMAAIASKTAVPILNKREFSKTPILLPPLAEQRAISAVLDSIDEAIERTEAVIAATERLRDALLHELLTRGVPGWHSEWKEAPGIGTVPACWEAVQLWDVAEVVMGQSPSGQHCNRSGYGTPLLNGPTEFARVHPIPAQWTTAPAKMASCGDLLFCVRGATAGRMNWANSDYAIGRGVAALRHRAGTRYQRYLRALVESMLPRLLTTVTGSTFPNLGRDEISNLRVLNPPLPEQQAIVDVLDSVDEPIERVREERDVLQSFRAAASDALLTGRVRVSA